MFETIGVIIVNLLLLIFLLGSKYRFETNHIGAALAAATALVSTIGIMVFYFALSKIKASILVPLTALYPAITVLLSFAFLQEKVNIVQGIGIVLALIAGVLLSI